MPCVPFLGFAVFPEHPLTSSEFGRMHQSPSVPVLLANLTVEHFMVNHVSDVIQGDILPVEDRMNPYDVVVPAVTSQRPFSDRPPGAFPSPSNRSMDPLIEIFAVNGIKKLFQVEIFPLRISSVGSSIAFLDTMPVFPDESGDAGCSPPAVFQKGRDLSDHLVISVQEHPVQPHRNSVVFWFDRYHTG